MTLDIETIIKQRLTLQSTQNALISGFGSRHWNFRAILNCIRTEYKTWSPEKQTLFSRIIGGSANFKNTNLFIKLNENSLYL